MDEILGESGDATVRLADAVPRTPPGESWRDVLRRGPRGETAALLVAVAAGAVAAGAGALPVTAAVIFVTAAGIGLRRPASVAPFLALLLPIGFSVSSVRGVQIPLLHTAVAGAAGGYALRLYRERQRPVLEAPDIAFAAFVAGVALSGAGPVAKPVWLHDLVLWGGLALVFHCSVRALAERVVRRRLYLALSVAGLVEAVYAIVQYVHASHSRFFLLGGAIVYPQPKATLQHPNSLGGFLVLALLVLLGAALAERTGVRRLGLAVVAVLLAGTIAPFSRGAWISLAAGIAVFVVAERRHRLLVGAAGAGLAVVAGAVAVLDRGPLGERISSLFSGDAVSLYGFRATLVRRAIDVISHHPLTGAGRFLEQGLYAGRPTLATHPHDMLLGVAVFFGIPAALAFTALLALAVRAAWRAGRARDASLAAEGVGALAALTALFVNGLLEYHFWNSALTVEIVLLLILAVALGRAAKQGRRPSPGERPGVVDAT